MRLEELLPRDRKRIELITEFLDAVLPPNLEGRIVIKSGLGGWPKCYMTTRSAAVGAVKQNLKGKEIYFALGKTSGDSNTESTMPWGKTLWADFDCDNDHQRVDTLDFLMDELEFPASAIVRSVTGFHAYWFLESPVGKDTIKGLNTRLSEKLGACRGMHNGPNAILRLPFTWLFPKKKYESATGVNRDVELIRLNRGLRYSVADVHSYLGPPRPADIPSVKKTEEKVPRTKGAPTGKTYKVGKGFLETVQANMDKSVIKDGKVTGCCFFGRRHMGGVDRRPSAVVFENGWYYCSACRLSEPFSRWSTRPEVSEWAQKLAPPHVVKEGDVLKPPVGAYGDVSSGIATFPVPRIVVRNISQLLLPFGDLDEAGKLVTECNYPDPSTIRDTAGALLYRVLLACLHEAYIIADDGKFAYDVNRFGDLLGYSRGADGRLSGKVRLKIGKALQQLTKVHLRVKLSSRWTGDTYGRLIEVDEKGVYKVKPEIWIQMGHPQACVDCEVSVLPEKDEKVAPLYLWALWEYRNRRKRQSLDIEDLARRAGVYNEDRAKKNRGAYMSTLTKAVSTITRISKTHALTLVEDKGLQKLNVDSIRGPKTQEPTELTA